MGLTALGYQRRTYQDVLNDKIQKAKKLFGEDIDTSDLTPLGKFIRINAYDQALAEEEIEQVYYSRFPNTASGQSLDRLLPFAAIARNPAEAASYKVKLTGTAGYTVPAGFLVSTDAELTFYTTKAVEIGADGTVEAEVCCTEKGTMGNVNVSAICMITNPDANISAVEGLESLSPGADEESDAQLRTRFQHALMGSGSCNANAIRSALLRIPTVKFAAVVENEGDEADADGRPPHSFECYVLGGNDYQQEIAECIFEKRPIGIRTTGDKTVTIKDASGNDRVVYFSETQNVNITVKVKIKTNTLYPADGAAKVQSGITDQINSLGIGNSVILSALYGPVHAVEGVVEVTELQLSTNGGTSFSAANVTVPQYGVAVCAGVNVEVAQ